MAATVMLQCFAALFLPVTAERSERFQSHARLAVDTSNSQAEHQPVLTGALNLTFFPDVCDPQLVWQGCVAITGSEGTPADPELVGKAISASRLSTRNFWSLFSAKYGNETPPCTELCNLTVSFATHHGVVLAPKSDIGCRLVNEGSAVTCDEDAKPEHVSMFARNAAGETTYEIKKGSSYHQFNKKKWKRGLANALPRGASDDHFFHHQEVSQDIDIGSDFDDIDYPVWKYAMALLGIFRIYGAPPSHDLVAGFPLRMMQPDEGISLAEARQNRAAKSGASTRGWYDDVQRATSRAQVYATVIRNRLLSGEAVTEFNKWFGKHSGEDLVNAQNRVKEVMNSLFSRFTGGLDFYYDRNYYCDENTYAYVVANGEECSSLRRDCAYYFDDDGNRKFIVYLCDSFMTASTYEQVGTIFHEVSHHREAYTYDVCLVPPSLEDENCETLATEAPECLKLAQRHGRLALDNADNYWYFAFDVGEAANRQKQCETRSDRATGPARNSDPDSDGDCHCRNTTVCYQGDQEGCQCSAGDDCEENYLPSCTNCRCQPPTDAIAQEMQERRSFRDCLGHDEESVEDQFPDDQGDCQCKDSYHCVRNTEAHEEEGCPYSGRGYHRLKFRASCLACECQPEREEIGEDPICSAWNHSESIDGDPGNCKCADNYECYRTYRGIRKRGCPVGNPGHPHQEIHREKFDINCRECFCKKPSQGPLQPDPIQQEPERCLHGYERKDNDCICPETKFCSTTENKDETLRPGMMCKVFDDTVSLTAFKAPGRGTGIQCHLFPTSCADHGLVERDTTDKYHNYNCKCKWGHACYLSGASKPGCVSTNMMRDVKHFVPVGDVRCEQPSSLKVCPQHAVRNEFADDNGNCACAGSKCWQELTHGMRPGCMNSGHKLSKIYFKHDCQGCKCMSEPPKCPTSAYQGQQAAAPDDDGNCKCPAEQLCRIRGTDSRCRASDGTSDQHEYFSLTCQDCECYSPTSDEQLLRQRTTATRQPPEPDPCEGFASRADYSSCEDVVKGSVRRNTAFFRFSSAATCKCQRGHHLDGKAHLCRSGRRNARGGHRREFAKQELAGRHCCCVPD